MENVLGSVTGDLYRDYQSAQHEVEFERSVIESASLTVANLRHQYRDYQEAHILQRAETIAENHKYSFEKKYQAEARRDAALKAASSAIYFVSEHGLV